MNFHLLPTSVCEIKDLAISSDLSLIPFSCSHNNPWLTEFASIFSRLYVDVYDIYNAVQRIKTFEICKQQECIPVWCVSPALYHTGGGRSLSGGCSLSRGLVSIQGVYVQGGLWQVDPPRRNMGSGCQTESDIIPEIPRHGKNDWHTAVKILPCPKLRLRAIKIEKFSMKSCNETFFLYFVVPLWLNFL